MLSAAQKREKARLVRVFREDYDEMLKMGMMKSNAVVEIAHRYEVSCTTVHNYLRETKEGAPCLPR